MKTNRFVKFIFAALIPLGLMAYDRGDFFPDNSNKDETVLSQQKLDQENFLINTTTLHLGYAYLNYSRLGQGFGKVIEWNPITKTGLFKLVNQKSYYPGDQYGAIWYDVIVNERGDVLQLLEPNSKYLTYECISLSDILKGESYPMLNQDLNDCIRVLY